MERSYFYTGLYSSQSNSILTYSVVAGSHKLCFSCRPLLLSHAAAGGYTFPRLTVLHACKICQRSSCRLKVSFCCCVICPLLRCQIDQLMICSQAHDTPPLLLVERVLYVATLWLKLCLRLTETFELNYSHAACYPRRHHLIKHVAPSFNMWTLLCESY